MLSLTRYMPRALAILFAVYLIPSLASASTNQFTIEPIPDASVVEFTRYESPVPVTSNAQGAITWQVLPFDAPNFLDWLGELLCSITDIEASINVFEVDPATGIVSLEAQKHRSGNNCSNKYWVYLVATDSQGNKAEVKWRITITEDTSPVFILRGISDQQIEEYDGYTSPRPYATGKVLGNLSYTLHDPSGKFSVDSSTGVVTLPPANSAYDTTPGASNSYSLTLTAKDDGDRSNTLNWTVTVTPIPPGSELTLSGPIDSTISENVDYRSTTIRATGKHTPPFTFSKDGVDAHLYEVNSAGIVTLPRKDFENPEDSNGDNIYEITVIATDANGYSASLSWNITVTDAPPRTFTISYASDTIVEGNSYLSNPPTMLGDAPWQPAVFSLKNDGLCGDDAIDDACLISIDPSTGRISLPAKAHAEPEDLDGDNLYTATIVLTDEEGSTTEAVWNLRVTFNMMKDTDGDGVLDTFELAEGTDPTSATSYLSVSGNTPDAVSIDADADGISNSQESAGINPYGDNNSDGVPNYLDPVDRGDNKAALCTIKMVSGFPDNTGTLMSKAICDMQFGLDPIFDNDQDGIANFRDNDSDNDGIPDVIEGGMYEPSNTLGIVKDSDGDGIPDFIDLDSDNDGIPDIIENHLFSRVDSTTGIATVFQRSGLSPLSALFNGALDRQGFDEQRLEQAIYDKQWMADFDQDGIPNYLDKDSDNDGIPDVLEGTVDGADIYAESYTLLSALDNNNNSIADVFEAQFTLGDDTNSNGIDDRYDVTITLGTDDNNNGIDDIYETTAASAFIINRTLTAEQLIALATNTNGIGNPDFINKDSDGDCISDFIEAGSTGILTNFGIDEGFADCFDPDGIFRNYNCLLESYMGPERDADGDNIPNHRDLDSDNDGLMDVDEGPLNTVDHNRDGMCDNPTATGAMITDASQLKYSGTSGTPDYLNLQSDGVNLDVVSAEIALGVSLSYQSSGQLNSTADDDEDGIDAQVDNDETLFGLTPIDCQDPQFSSHPLCNTPPVDCTMDPTHPDCDKPDYCYDPAYAHLPECQDPPPQCELDPGLPECAPPAPVNCFKDFAHPLCLDPSRNPQNGKIKTDERGSAGYVLLALITMLWFARRRMYV